MVAPNQRGSTGYGAAHRNAIGGAWGGPDLADVLRLGRIRLFPSATHGGYATG